MQGEQDATQVDTAASYETNLQNLLDQCQAYIGAPLIFTRIQTGDESMTENATVRAAQASVAAANPATSVMIDIDALSHYEDWHLDAAGMKALGQMLYSAVTW
jgi:hypothetical protein